ncbi:hypothetical protein ABBQ38_011709 [Trebouxia sp. C0009 RCD-2024]
MRLLDASNHFGSPGPAHSASPSAQCQSADLAALPKDPASMAGPTPWCNWVVRGQVLAGAYPASTDDKETDKILTILLERGIEVFVCLQAEVSLNIPECMWRAGRGLRPYIKDAQRILTRARLNGSARITQSKLNFLHLAIIDGSITTDSAISRLAEDCCDRVRAGEKLYIHCWGGHGRTGTLVALMLARLYDLTCADALKYTQAFHDSRRYPQNVRSPQTAIQRTQVRRLLSRDIAKPQPSNKGLLSSLASEGTAGILASAARPVAAAVTQTRSAIRRSTSEERFRSRSQQNSSPQRPVGASPMRHSTSLSSSHMQSAYGQPLQLRPSGRVVSNAVSRPQASMHAASVSRVHSSSDRIAAVQGNLIQRQSSNSVSDGTRFSRSGSQK